MARLTLVLNDTIQQKIRIIQAEKIKTSTKSVSFSAVVNELLAKQLGVKIK